MILVLVLVMVGFFIAGYHLHKKQYHEKERELDLALDKYKDELSYYEHAKKDISRMHRELSQQADTLQVNFNNRWREVETRINENDVLKNQIFLIKKNCSCGGAKIDGPTK